MKFKEFENLFNNSLGANYKTKDLDLFNKKLIKEKADVSFLEDIILEKQQYHRTYFQVSLASFNNINDKLKFIEDNFDKLNDWWHVDQLSQFVDKMLEFDVAYDKAKNYIQSNMTFARRWGYVLFMPSLVKDINRSEEIFKLFKNDDEYYVQMAEAWLLSYLAIYNPEKTLEYLKSCNLNYNIVGKAIQKTCDSFRVSNEYKEKFKQIRKLYK